MLRHFLCTAGLLLGLAGAQAHAAAPLVLAFDELLPWKTQNGKQFGGAYTEIVRELARRTGDTLEIKTCPLKRCLHMLEDGQADLFIGAKDSPERRRYLHFLRTPYRNSSSDRVFYVRKQGGSNIARYQDLQGLRIGVKMGAEYFAPFDQDRTLRKDEAKDMAVNFQKLLLGRLDAVVIPEDQGEALLVQLGLGSQIGKAALRVADASPRAVAIAKASPQAARLAAFEQAMAAMVKDGSLKGIIDRYYYQALHLTRAAVQIN